MTRHTLNLDICSTLFAIEVGRNPLGGRDGILPTVLKLTSNLLRHRIAQKLVVRSVNRSDGNDTLVEKAGK